MLNCRQQQKYLHCNSPMKTFLCLRATFPSWMFELPPKEKEKQEANFYSRKLNPFNIEEIANENKRNSYLSSIKHYISTIGEDADGPRRQVIVHVIEQHSRC